MEIQEIVKEGEEGLMAKGRLRGGSRGGVMESDPVEAKGVEAKESLEW